MIESAHHKQVPFVAVKFESGSLEAAIAIAKVSIVETLRGRRRKSFPSTAMFRGPEFSAENKRRHQRLPR